MNYPRQVRLCAERPGASGPDARAPRPTSASNDGSTSPVEPSQVFQQVEGLIVSNVNSDRAGSRVDWQQVEGCWVLRPPDTAGPPEAVAMFVGGAFVGAAPEVVYRLFLECLAARNVLVRFACVHVAVPRRSVGRSLISNHAHAINKRHSHATDMLAVLCLNVCSAA